MAVNLNIKTNSKQVSAKFKKFGAVLPRIIDKGVKQAGFQLVDRIRTQTKKGIDFKDRRFAPYSEGYIKQLQREGKPTAVDLFYSGRMLGALTLAFSRKEEIDKAFFNQVTTDPQREFFGFNTKTEKIINKAFNRFVEKELQKFKL